jgi:hypothetical protein
MDKYKYNNNNNVTERTANKQIRPSQIMVMYVGIVAFQTAELGELTVRLPHATTHGKPAPSLQMRLDPPYVYVCYLFFLSYGNETKHVCASLLFAFGKHYSARECKFSLEPMLHCL